MLHDKFKNHQLILASGSPRRQQFFKELGFPFKIELKPIDEVFPSYLKGHEIPDFLAELKASVYKDSLLQNDILITSDTIVLHKNVSLGKPTNNEDAFTMLKTLSNDSHVVITSVCFTSKDKQIIINCTTKVSFKKLTDEEIWYYIHTYKPFDKAGAYGIQEWLGHIAITDIKGSYNNVMGLPTHLVYETLMNMVN
ncbi:MAG: Maf-like protein [Cellulophaga sp.]